MRFRSIVLSLVFLFISSSFAQIVIPDFGIRGNIPEPLYQEFMNNLRLSVARKTAMAVTVGEFASSGMASSLDPKFTKIIAQNEGAQYALSGEFRQVYGDPYSLSMLIAEADSARHSDLISRQFVADNIDSLVDLLSTEIAAFVEPINSLPSGGAGLYISTEPDGAIVYIDGLEIGLSPIDDVLMLEPNTYSIELRKQGYLAVIKQLELNDGITELLNIQLTEINGGTIQVDTEPSAKIIIDGRELSFAPLSFQALPGVHTIELVRLGFEFVALPVHVREFRVTIIDQKLKPISNFMIFWDLVDKQLVYIDGQLQIKPYLLEPSPGLHKIEIRREGETTSFEINLAATGIYYLDFDKQDLIFFNSD